MATEVTSGLRKVRVLINPRSGVYRSFADIQDEIERCWDQPGLDISYQFSRSEQDGRAKTRRAVEEGVETVLAVGGDGMVNCVGSQLVGTEVALGVIPTGSGNGFARHFNIPLIPQKAVQALAHAGRQRIDVGTANQRPFFVTCSMAWDAAIVRSFEKFPVRGIVPYLLAGAYELINYVPQPISVTVDGDRRFTFEDPLVFTVANLTEFGGGARIAPMACPDDGVLELVVVARKNAVSVVADFVRLLDGRLQQIDKVTSLRFSRLEAKRSRPAPIQLDGEFVDGGEQVTIEVRPRALTVLTPSRQED